MRIQSALYRFIYVFLLLLFANEAEAAFEPVSESPWFQGGIASSLFPRTPLVIMVNPACLGLLEGHGVAASASRPFGLRGLDRTAIAGDWMFRRIAVGAALSLSGDESYTEGTAVAAAAYRIMNGVVLGADISIRNLQISGYGRATGVSTDIGVVWSPTEGVYSTVLFRSVIRSDLGDSGDPASPRSVELAIGVVPVDRVSLGIGAGRQEGLDTEFSFHTAFSPQSIISLGAGIITNPSRFWAALSISVSPVNVEYGYGEHSTLPGTHSVALCWGNCAADPPALSFSDSEQEETPAPEFPLNINTASEEDLVLIPGIGPGRASAISAWMRQNGPVSSINELDDIPGIGPSLMEVLREFLVAE
ncbi:MAG: helix-hairpin-helix domain-containing protein [Candidatus Fermentibacteraceae bacterium]|nr:helix-hairpin-helix domain-containing protein [Candidatus Fermentibacteraceae bacterium]